MSHKNVSWDSCLRHAALTDVGMRRSNNQDAHTVVIAGDVPTWQERGHLFIVADGMGAHAAGELASKLAVDNVPHLYLHQRDLTVPEALREAVAEANAEIHRRGQSNPDFRNMGTTLSLLVLLPQGAVVAHVGDSRVYRLRGDVLEQLTFDHSLVWELQAAGKMPENKEEAAKLPTNVITRSLGPRPSVKVDLEGPFPLEVGDAFLLCSDGLSGLVQDEEIGTMLSCLPPDEAARVLVDLANLRGGPDNTTVVIAQVTGRELTTEGAGAGPLAVSRSAGRSPAKTHPALWIVAAVLFVAGLVLGTMGLSIPAGLALVGALGAAGVGAMNAFGGNSAGGKKRMVLAPGRTLGNGPHTRTECHATPALTANLAAVVGELRQAVAKNDWAVDWSQFNEFVRQANAATKDKNFKKAVTAHAHAISFIMQQLRKRK